MGSFFCRCSRVYEVCEKDTDELNVGIVECFILANDRICRATCLLYDPDNCQGQTDGLADRLGIDFEPLRQ